MSDKRFKVCIDSNNGVGLFDNSVKLLFVKFTNEEDALRCKDSLKHHCNLMNELYDENERLRNQLERKTILLKIRTKHMDDGEKSFHELLNYLESFCYKSNIDGNYAKQDIINILNNWEIREYD